MSPFLNALRSGRVLLMDGAMGTELLRRGLKPGVNAATSNELHPGRVRAVHQAYLAAGAQVLLSNTFLIAASTYTDALEAVGRRHETPDEWIAAFAVMPRANVYRLAAVGPVAGDPRSREFDRPSKLYVQFLPGNSCPLIERHTCRHVPDAILFETCSSPRVKYVLPYMVRWGKPPALLSLAYTRNGASKLVTQSGHSPEWFAERAKQWGVVALGVNCGKDIGMDEIIEIVRRYRQVTDLPLFARPNAGTPKKKGSRWVYLLTPKEMAARLPELLEAGVSMVGGCCGTTPAHIATMRPVVDAWNARRK